MVLILLAFDPFVRFPTILTGQFCRSRFNMQRPSEIKRRKISDTAARLFATQPFHKVRLDDVAAAAGVGKGTLYIYFKSKEDLYFSLIYDGFAQLVDRLGHQIRDDHSAAWNCLSRIVHEMVSFAFQHP